jgi:hypothetical protein
MPHRDNNHSLDIHPTDLRPARRADLVPPATPAPLPTPGESSSPTQTEAQALLAAERRRMEKDMADLRRELAAERQALAARQAMLDAQHQQRQDESQKLLDAERQRLKQMDAELAAARQALELERRALDEERTRLLDERAQAERDRDALDRQRDALANQSQSLEAERRQVAALRLEIGQEQSQLEDAKRRLDEQTQRLADQTRALEVERETLARQRQELETTRRDLQQQGLDLDRQRRQLQLQAAQLEAGEADLRLRHENLSRREQELTDRKRQLQDDIRRHEEYVAQVRQAEEAARRAQAEALEAQKRALDANVPQTRAAAADDQTASVHDDDMRALLTDLQPDPFFDREPEGQRMPYAEPREVSQWSGGEPPTSACRPAPSRRPVWAVLATAVVLAAVAVATWAMLKGPHPSSSVVQTPAAVSPEGGQAPDVQAAPLPGATAGRVSEATERQPAATATAAESKPVAAKAGQSAPVDTSATATSSDAVPATVVPADQSQPAAAEALPKIPGGVWPYTIPENLTPSADLEPTLQWARRELAEPIAAVQRAYAFDPQQGPRQAIAVRLDDTLRDELGRFLPPPYLAGEKVIGADGTTTVEQVSTLLFLEFLVKGRPYLFVLKRRDGDGSIVPGRQGSFVLIPGAIQEHTVVLDPNERALPEPLQ